MGRVTSKRWLQFDGDPDHISVAADPRHIATQVVEWS